MNAREYLAVLRLRRRHESDEEFEARRMEEQLEGEALIERIPADMTLDEYEVAVKWRWRKHHSGGDGGTRIAVFAIDAVAGGVLGNAAFELLRAYLQRVGASLQRKREDHARLYVIEIAILNVGMRLTEPRRVLVQDCCKVSVQGDGSKHLDHWLVTVKAGVKVYRVQVPVDDPANTTVSEELP